MTTMTTTATYTGSQTFTRQPVQRPAQREQTRIPHGETNQRNDGISPQEHNEANAFLSRIPQMERFQSAGNTPRNLKLILQSNAVAKSGGGGFSGSPSVNSLDTPINVLVLELGDVNTKRRLPSLNDLRTYLRENTAPKKRVFLVSQDSLIGEVVGLLGYRLELDPDFFAVHTTREDLPLELSLPSSIVSRQSLRLEYCRSGMEHIEKEHISLCVSQKTQDTWTTVILLNNHELTERQIAALRSHLRGDQEDWSPNLFEATVKSILYSTYTDPKASGSLSSALYAVFPILVSQWTVMAIFRSSEASIARRIINQLSEDNLSEEAREEKMTWLRDVAGKGKVWSPQWFDTYMRIDSMLRYLEDCETLQARLDPGGLVDTELIKSDISFLITRQKQLERENEVLYSKRELLLSLADQGSNGLPKKTPPRQSGKGEETPDPRSTLTSTATPGGPAAAGGGPPGSNTPSSDLYRSFASHVRTKIDQIAYMTNLLFSLTFIASIYGMNLDIFTGDGKVELARFLATALPFAFVVFS
ncbi:hypothetical protein CC80DRAFT_589911 [Byssothecium circinans]|uniref:Uncharacterized protein n=1 Tax=Byssothecium circinans TaxID=147558 RepID=A0A6A5UHC7_9PLEO|nr:hypothetical protein CC80DRAFT_589911 [Byssothecium circinans]